MNKIEKILKKYPDTKHHSQNGSFDINSYKEYCGKNFKYLEWFCKNYLEISSDTELNIHEYNSEGYVGLNRLSDFFNFFEKNSSKLSNKDIYFYSFKELKDALKAVTPSASDIKKLNTNIVYEDGEVLIVHPTTYEAHKLYGANTKWCTISQESTYKSYNYITYDYNSYNYNFLLILIDKLNNEKSAASINCRVSPEGTLTEKVRVVEASCVIYDEKDYEIFNSRMSQQHKFNKMLNDELNKEKTSSYFLMPEKLKIASKYCASLILSSSSLKDDKRYYNLITDKFIMRVIKNDNLSNLKILELLQNMKKNYNICLDKYYKYLLKYSHDKKCNSLKITSSKEDKKDNLKNLHNKLSGCSCLKFNKLEFLNSFIDLITKDLSLKEDYTSIIKILNEKISNIKLISKSKKDIINHLMTNDIKNANIIFNNLNLNKNELLFLQVYSENQSVKDLCFDVTKIPTDFAQEFLKLKNITTIEDLNL